MSNGQFKTFDIPAFGWNSSQPASTQRAAIQSAFDSGEPLLMPCGETVLLDDVPLVMQHPTHLIGHGADIGNSALASSQFRSGASNTTMLKVLSSNATIRNLNFHSDAAGSRGIEIGDDTHEAFGVLLDRVSIGSNFKDGLTIVNAQEWEARGCWINGQDSAIRVDNKNSDAGDSRIMGGEFNAFGPTGAGLLLLNGGGLFVGAGAKFLNCYNHIRVDWRRGGSGGLMISDASLEGCRHVISIDIDGDKPFERMEFSNLSFGNYGVAIAVRNFQSAPWIKELCICDNVIKIVNLGAGQQLPAIDIGSADMIDITGNVIDGQGICYAGIVVRPPCSGIIDTQIIRGCATSFQLNGAAVTVNPFQG